MTAKKLKLYLISQDVNNEYDTFDSAVVATYSEEEARLIHPKSIWRDNTVMLDKGWIDENRFTEWAYKESDVKVKFIGYATDNIEPNTIIISSFNAG